MDRESTKRRGGDKWPEYTPDIGWSGRLFVLALVTFLLLGSLGWMLER